MSNACYLLNIKSFYDIKQLDQKTVLPREEWTEK